MHLSGIKEKGKKENKRNNRNNKKESAREMKAGVHLILLLFHHLNDTSRFKVHLPLKAPLQRREQMEGKKSTQVTTQWITALGKNKEREKGKESRANK